MKTLLLLALVGCSGGALRVSNQHADAMSAEDREELGEDRIALKWKFETADRRTEIAPQEFAAAAACSPMHAAIRSAGIDSMSSAEHPSRGNARKPPTIAFPSTSPAVTRSEIATPTARRIV